MDLSASGCVDGSLRWVDYDNARELIYGMPYNEWKNKYQKEATKEQLEKLKEK